MKLKIILPTLLLLNSCASLNDSMLLGAGLGAGAGVLSQTTAYQKTGTAYSSEEVTNSAVVGLAIGLIGSFLIHKSVEEKRGSLYSSDPEIYFGDLPPSPFIMTPKLKTQKGGK